MYFRLRLTAQHAQGVQREGLQLVLAGIHRHGSHETAAARYGVGDAAAVSDASRENYGVHLAAQRGGHRADLFGHGVTEQIESRAGLLVALVLAKFELFHRIGSRERHQTAASDDECPRLLVGITPRVAEVYQRARRDGPRTLGRNGSLAVESVVAVYGAPLQMRRDGYAASHVGYHEVHVFVSSSEAFGMYARRGFLVERVEYRSAANLAYAAQLGDLHPLVHHHGVGYVGLHAAFAGYLGRDHRAQVRRMLRHAVHQLVDHEAVDAVHPAFDGAQ